MSSKGASGATLTVPVAEPLARPASRATTTSGWEDEIGVPSSPMQKFNRNFREGWKRNTGLLLFVAAQAFYAMMDTAVKVLHGVDPPVTTLQLIFVRMVRRAFVQ